MLARRDGEVGGNERRGGNLYLPAAKAPQRCPRRAEPPVPRSIPSLGPFSPSPPPKWSPRCRILRSSAGGGRGGLRRAGRGCRSPRLGPIQGRILMRFIRSNELT